MSGETLSEALERIEREARRLGAYDLLAEMDQKRAWMRDERDKRIFEPDGSE